MGCGYGVFGIVVGKLTSAHVDMVDVNLRALHLAERNVKENNVGAVISSNMSIGVNVFFNTLKKLAPLLYDFDIEIIEAHHNQKKDAPSGTAMTAFEVIAESLERDPEEVGVFGRKGLVGKRTSEEIGVHAIRGGDIVGDHTIMFVGDGYDEVITGFENVKDDIVIFHAGTALKDGNIVTNGGRVLNICALGTSLEDTRAKVYKAAEVIDFDGKYYRKDIGLNQEAI